MQIQQIKKRLPLIIALICGVFAIVLLNIYLKRREVDMIDQVRQIQEQAKAQAQEQQAQQAAAQAQAQKAEKSSQKMGIVLVAQNDIPAQAPLTPADLIFKELPAQEIDPGAVNSLDQAIGQITGVAIVKGEQILKAKLLSPSQISKSLAEVTPEGKRAVSIKLDAASNMGLIKPGDYVDVFALIAPPAAAGTKKKAERLFMISQNVKVLAVGNEIIGSVSLLTKDKAAAGSKGLVALAATPQEASMFSFLQENGKIRLILRSPDDKKIEAVRPADWDTLLQYISGRDNKVESDGETAASVEIYRGLEKEVIPLRGK